MTGPKRKVMILDDNIISVLVVEDLLTKHGYQVVKMTAPTSCIAKINYEAPDVLLIDIKMPRLSPDDLIEALHRLPEHDDLIIVLYSDLPAAELERICHEKDINGYFCKSMELARLPEFIDCFF